MYVQAKANGLVSIRIPHSLISDWAGNLLIEDLTEQIYVRESDIAIKTIRMVFTAGKVMQPWATISFNSNEMIEECSEKQAIVVTSLNTNTIASTVRSENVVDDDDHVNLHIEQKGIDLCEE